MQEKQAERARLIEEVVGKAKATSTETGVKNEEIIHSTGVSSYIVIRDV